MKRVVTIGVGLLTIAVGCATRVSNADPKEMFFRSHPSQRSAYSKLDAISIGVMSDHIDEMYRLASGVISSIRKQHPNDPVLQTTLDSLDQRISTSWRHRAEALALMRNEIGMNAHLYMFRYESGDIEEDGFLALRDGKIIFRAVTASGQ